MANLPFLDLYDHVLPYLPGAEPAVVDLHIRKIIKEFLRRSTVWREDIPLTIVAGTYVYPLVPASPIARVSDVMGVGSGLGMFNIPNMPEHNRPAPGYVSSSPRRGWWVQNLPYINIQTSDAVAHVRAALTLTVEPGVVEFPEFVLNNHVDIVSSGIIASMMAMPGKPWTQFDMAKTYWPRFANGTLALRAALRDGGQPNASTMTGPRFGK